MDELASQIRAIISKLMAILESLNQKDSLQTRRFLRECMQTACSGADLSSTQREDFEKHIEQLKLYTASNITDTNGDVQTARMSGANFVDACLAAKIALQQWKDVTPGADASFIGLRMKSLRNVIIKPKELEPPEILARVIETAVELLTVSEDAHAAALQVDRLREIACSQWQQCKTELTTWLAGQDVYALEV